MTLIAYRSSECVLVTTRDKEAEMRHYWFDKANCGHDEGEFRRYEIEEGGFTIWVKASIRY